MAQKIQGSQRDFSYGEIDVTLKRADDHPARKAGLRQMANMRVLNSGAAQNRPGRSALFPANVAERIEEVTMSPGNQFKLVFGAGGGTGQLLVFDASGAQVASFVNQGNGAPLPWTLLNTNEVGYAQLGLSIYITFPGIVPQVLSWNSATTWSIADYAEQVIGSQKRTPFYRISPQNITLLPAAQTGVGVNVLASEAIFTAAHVGTRIRYINRQMLITAVAGPYPATSCTVTIEESLPGHQNLTFAVDPAATFSTGDVIRGNVTGSLGQVSGINSAGKQITVQLLNTSSTAVNQGFYLEGAVAFTTSDTAVGPGGGLLVNTASVIDVPNASAIWDEEVMNAMRGYPASVFVDQFRLGFCNFPAVPNGISWSAINAPTDLYVGANPSNAMFELAPDKVQVLYVVPGAESSEFVFCDKKLYYIKIDASNPLKPGSVGFQTLSGDGCAQVQPRLAQETILYVNAGGNSVMAILAPGAYYRPFNTRNLSDLNGHLFSSIKAIAAPTADSTFSERYIYVLNDDGSVVAGKYSLQDGQIAPAVGWGPWSGVGDVKWVSALGANVLFTTRYFDLSTICEQLDDDQYLDGALFVNNLPAAFTAPVGKGPLWWLQAKTVSLIDQGTRMMGEYQIDGNGFIVPQNNGGEDLSIASLVAGQPWTSTVEPFCPNAQPGADMGQRMKMRQVSLFDVYVVHSTGFVLGGLFSGRQTNTSPPLGTLMNQRRFPAWNQGDDPTLPPPDRETVESHPPPGSTFDPRVVLIKDTPGPLQLLELGIEVSI